MNKNISFTDHPYNDIERISSQDLGGGSISPQPDDGGGGGGESTDGVIVVIPEQTVHDGSKMVINNSGLPNNVEKGFYVKLVYGDPVETLYLPATYIKSAGFTGMSISDEESVPKAYYDITYEDEEWALVITDENGDPFDPPLNDRKIIGVYF